MKEKRSFNMFSKTLPLFGMLLSFVLLFAVGIDASAANTQPTNLKQTAATTTKASISWTAPVTTSNHYNRMIVQCSKDNKTWVDKGYVAANVTAVTLTGIERGTSCYVRIKAVYFDDSLKKITDDGAWSEAIEVATIPYSIGGITQSAATKSSVTYTWPEAKGANCYDVYIGSSYSSTKFVVRMTGQTITVKGKKQGKAYYVKVVPVRMTAQKYAAIGMESYGTVKTTPKAVTVAKENPWERGTKSIEFTWTSPNKLVDGYQVKIYNSKSKVVKTAYTRKTSYTYTKAAANQYYKIKVRPYINVNNSKKYGAWSKTGAALLEPQITGVSQEDAKAVITWTAIKGASGYEVYAGFYPDIESMNKIGETNSSTTTFTTNVVGDTTVAANKRVYFAVKAKKTIKDKKFYSLASNPACSN